MQINYIAVLKLPNETPLIKMEHVCHKLSISSHHMFHIGKPRKIGVYLPTDCNRFQSGKPPKIGFY